MPSLDWESHKAEIQRLYIHENKKILEVVSEMKSSRNFTASESSYQRKLREWGIRKNRLGRENWKIIDYKIKKKKQQSGRSPQVYIDGELCPPQKVRKEIARQAFCSTFDKLFVRNDIPSPMTPDGIQIYSPGSSNSPKEWSSNSPWLEFLNILPSDVFQEIIVTPSPFQFPSLFKKLNRVVDMSPNNHTLRHGVSQPTETLVPEEALGMIMLGYLRDYFGAARLRFSCDISNTLLVDLFCLSNNFIHREEATEIMRRTGFDRPTSFRRFLSMRSTITDTLVGYFFVNAMGMAKFDLLEMMLDEGVDPVLLEDQRMILEFTAKHRNIEVANRLTGAIFSHLAPDYCTKEKWESTLNLAYESGQISLFSGFIQAGVPIQNFDLVLSIFSAIKDGKVQTAKLLLQNGANVNLQGRFLENYDYEMDFQRSFYDVEISLLGLAAKRGDIEMICMLLNAGADIDGPHNSLYCPLILALEDKHYSVAEILVQVSADVFLAEAKMSDLSKREQTWLWDREECLINYLQVDGHSCLNLLNTFLSKGAKPSYMAVIKAVESNNVEFALTLLRQFGAFGEELEDLGYDAIHHAIALEKTELIWRFHLAGIPLAKAVRWIPNEEMLDFLESLGIISDIPCTNWAGIIGAARLRKQQTLAQRLLFLSNSSYVGSPLPTVSSPNMASWQREMEYVRQIIPQGLPISDLLVRVAGWNGEAFTSPMLDITDPVVPIMGLFLVQAQMLSLPTATPIVDNGILHSIGLLLETGGDVITSQSHLSEDYNLCRWIEVDSIPGEFAWCDLRAATGKCRCKSNLWLSCCIHDEKSVLASVVIWGSLPLFQTFLTSFEWSSQDIGKSLAAVMDSGEHRSMIHELLALRPDPNAIYNRDTILESAARHTEVSIVRTLLRIGASAQSIGLALQRAAHNGHMELINMLLEAGADVNCPARRGVVTALQSVVDHGLIPIASQLLDAGADINALGHGKYGRTALQRAASKGRIDMLHMLLYRGARVYDDALNQGYRANYVRAVRMAEKNGHKAAAKFLKSHGGWTDEDEIFYSKICDWELECFWADENREDGVYL